MSDVLPLPPSLKLDHYRELAGDLQQACESSDTDAVLRWATQWTQRVTELRGIKINPEIKAQIEHDSAGLEARWRGWQPTDDQSAQCKLSVIQQFLAQAHGFANWPAFENHINELQDPDSPVAQFEDAADAIVNGDLSRLENLLKQHPGLARQRSTREHHSTLLHYISANGIEDFRQKTPPNIVAITRLLLDAGAEVEAESDAYRGHSTTLGLTSTSLHPEKAGVMIPLLQVLLNAGASVFAGPDRANIVNDCLANGRGAAAEFLANHGAPLDLEGAAGVGRLELVRSLFNEAPDQQRRNAFAWACQFGRTSVVGFLLDRGVEIDVKLRHHCQTGLHWAAYGGHPETVQLLLRRGAPIRARDEHFGGTPLDWAVHSRDEWGAADKRRRYDEVVRLLVQAASSEGD